MAAGQKATGRPAGMVPLSRALSKLGIASHPRNRVERVYLVSVRGEVRDEDCRRMEGHLRARRDAPPKTASRLANLRVLRGLRGSISPIPRSAVPA